MCISTTVWLSEKRRIFKKNWDIFAAAYSASNNRALIFKHWKYGSSHAVFDRRCFWGTIIMIIEIAITWGETFLCKFLQNKKFAIFSKKCKNVPLSSTSCETFSHKINQYANFTKIWGVLSTSVVFLWQLV